MQMIKDITRCKPATHCVRRVLEGSQAHVFTVLKMPTLKKKKMHVSGQNFSSADMKNDHGKFLLSIVYFLFCALTT